MSQYILARLQCFCSICDQKMFFPMWYIAKRFTIAMICKISFVLVRFSSIPRFGWNELIQFMPSVRSKKILIEIGVNWTEQVQFVCELKVSNWFSFSQPWLFSFCWFVEMGSSLFWLCISHGFRCSWWLMILMMALGDRNDWCFCLRKNVYCIWYTGHTPTWRNRGLL